VAALATSAENFLAVACCRKCPAEGVAALQPVASAGGNEMV